MSVAPGTTPVALPSGVRVIERDWLSSNLVLMLGREDATLVDTGYATHADTTLALVRHALDGRRLDRIVNTHLHSDHCGGNAALQRAYACRATVPSGCLQAARRWDTEALTFTATGQRCERFEAHDAVSPGDTLRLADLDWLALAAPGHDPTSVVLWQPEHRVLLSADALWENGFGSIFPELAGEPGFSEQRDTLDMIAALRPRVVVPGHGRVFDDVEGALARAYSRLDYLSADPVRNARAILKVLVKFLLLERRALTVAQVAQAIDEATYFVQMNQRFFGQPADALAREAAAALVKAGAARLEGDLLVDA